ncbi:MAG: hypothetical protein WDA75_09430 [Candidatus Latescibacterota bacterium]|jgi:hypothetical protein
MADPAPPRAPDPGSRFRRCLLAALLIHLAMLGFLDLMLRREAEERVMRVRFATTGQRLPWGLQPDLAPTGPPSELGPEAPGAGQSGYGRMGPWADGDLLGRADPGGTESRWYTLGEGGYASFEGSALPGAKGGWRGSGDAAGYTPAGPLPAPGLEMIDEETGLPLALDLLELDAQSRRLNVALIDPETGRLKLGWIHLPAYMKYGHELQVAMETAARGFGLPGGVPLRVEVKYFSVGKCCKHPTQPCPCENAIYAPDPIHSLPLCCTRHILGHTEMRDYSVIDLRYIDVESTPAMVDYLAAGGFGIVGYGQLRLLQANLADRFNERVAEVKVGLDHPLFRVFFTVGTYRPGSNCGTRYRSIFCSAVGPLSGVTLDGRLVAISGVPRYEERCDCPANRLYINTYVFALTQPGPMNRAFLLPREP